MTELELDGVTGPPAGRSARAAKPPQHWADLALPERDAAVTAAGLPRFRAAQISKHYFGHGSADPGTWTDLSASVAATARESWFPELLREEVRRSCDSGATVKSAWRIAGGSLVESVVMAYPDRVTVCVSSQAGCGIGCPFCATGQQGLNRNLSTAEITEQVRHARQTAASGELGLGPARLSNVVFMGMGEPLANFRAVLAAVHRIVDPEPGGFGMSARNVTVSTVGLVPRIDDLAAAGLPVTLALSLHAPDDELRDELVPVNHRWPVASVLAAADRYAAATRRRYSIEYALIRDVNDQPHRADQLGALLRGRLTHVNLIPLNPTPGSKWTASDPAVADEFVRRVRAAGVPVTVRDTRGREIDGACGQLAAATA